MFIADFTALMIFTPIVFTIVICALIHFSFEIKTKLPKWKLFYYMHKYDHLRVQKILEKNFVYFSSSEQKRYGQWISLQKRISVIKEEIEL